MRAEMDGRTVTSASAVSCARIGGVSIKQKGNSGKKKPSEGK